MNKYITFYNFLGTTICFLALYFTFKLFSDSNSQTNLVINYRNVGFCQTFFLLEIVNILIGKSNSGILVTFAQLASRLFISWVVCFAYNLPSKNMNVLMFSSWYLSDLIRYFYYLTRFSIFKHLRYTLFLVTYPMGTFIEMYGIYLLSRVFSEKMNCVSIFLCLIMFIYIPGFVFLYTHMLKQRRKQINNKTKTD